MGGDEVTVPPAQQGWAGGPPAGPPPAGWAPYPYPRPLPRFPHPEPREYHLMLRTWNYSWWRPVLGVFLVFFGLMVVAPIVLLPVLVVGVMAEGGSFLEKFERALTLEAVGPSALLYLNLTLGSSILVCWAVMRWVHRMRPRWLTSVVPKMRWGLFFQFVGLSVVALVVMLLVGLVMPGDQEAQVFGKVNDFSTTTAVLAAIVLLTTPLQAAGEEYVFRGYLMQAVGALTGSKWLALLATSSLFAVAHGVQNFPLFFDRFVFALIAGWLVIRTGGLEAGIAMHILNNFVAFGLALAYSDLSSTLNVSEVGWDNIPLTLAQGGTYAALVLYVARRKDLQRRTRPPREAVPAGVTGAPGPTLPPASP